MNKMKEPILVKVRENGDSLQVFSDEDCIEIYNLSEIRINRDKTDFAAWIFMPIAMYLGRDLVIDGVGSYQTVENFRTLSEIWESWDLQRFSSVNVTFRTTENYTQEATKTTLAFYSGGVDSTYNLLNQSEKKDALLTVHGMDYKYSDSDRFEKLKIKTDKFSSLVGNKRIFISSNIYDVYNKYKINSGQSHVSHIFALAGLSFLFSESFNTIEISSDYSLEQQFIVHPWGSNSATNKFFSDGCTKFITHDDSITRLEKLPLLLKNETALDSLSFCIDYKYRPENCGVCSKCMRTKLMFQVVCGYIPKIFKDQSLNESSIDSINLKKNSEIAFFLDLYNHAKKNGRIDDIPKMKDNYSRLKSRTKMEYIKLKLIKMLS